MKKHFVTFYSPGSFVDETDTKEINDWDVNVAKDMAKNINQRYGAKPYAFRFTTKERGPDDFDSKVVKTSGMYFLGGRVRSIEEVILLNDPKEEILRWNMITNKYDRVIETNNSYKRTATMSKEDVVLDFP